MYANLFLLRHQRYTMAVNALHLYMVFTPSKSQYKITPYTLTNWKSPHTIRGCYEYQSYLWEYSSRIFITWLFDRGEELSRQGIGFQQTNVRIERYPLYLNIVYLIYLGLLLRTEIELHAWQSLHFLWKLSISFLFSISEKTSAHSSTD